MYLDKHSAATSVVDSGGDVGMRQNRTDEPMYTAKQPTQQSQAHPQPFQFPQQQQQQQQPEYASSAPHATMPPAGYPTYNNPGSVGHEMGGYATYASAPHHTNPYTVPQSQPQPQPQQQYQPQQQPQQQPPPVIWPSHLAPPYSDYEKWKAESEKQPTHAGSEKHHTPATSTKAGTANVSTANGLLNCLKDSIHSVTFADAMPVITILGAAFAHHYRFRKSEHVKPYSRSRWVKYVNNALFAYNIYTFAIDNGFIKREDTAKREMSWDERHLAEDLTTSNVRSRGIDSGEVDIEQTLQAILGSLFVSNRGNNLMDQFDDRWAVHRATAEYFYDTVYCRKSNLCNANAQVLGGAAAIRALQSESQMAMQQQYVPHSKPEHMVMGMALSEADALLSHKSAVDMLTVDETLENVGRIALATIIKIKIDQEWQSVGPYNAY
ncbi:hypothetical protein H4R20_006074 [Coemansia guatemalensis]|uniref:Uncharacterized protein n=1 Tax=Coemansia guatemalensis TaxID=2761395 RepID=A0A9W8HWM6_9FUNG|nr:hypothetical protein H4R20_006074 [Coemansia guatemalensis]